MVPYRYTITGASFLGKGVIEKISLIAGSANASLTAYDNNAPSGTVIAKLKALANESKSEELEVPVETGVYLDWSGTGAEALVYIR